MGLKGEEGDQEAVRERGRAQMEADRRGDKSAKRAQKMDGEETKYLNSPCQELLETRNFKFLE